MTRSWLCALAMVAALAGLAVAMPAQAPSSAYTVSATWAQLPSGMGWGKVISVATDDKDNVWVLRRDEPYVLVFTSGGTFVKSWGRGLFNPGNQGAHSIYVDHSGFVWTTDN